MSITFKATGPCFLKQLDVSFAPAQRVWLNQKDMADYPAFHVRTTTDFCNKKKTSCTQLGISHPLCLLRRRCSFQTSTKVGVAAALLRSARRQQVVTRFVNSRRPHLKAASPVTARPRSGADDCSRQQTHEHLVALPNTNEWMSAVPS